jgi:hypothetical protein
MEYIQSFCNEYDYNDELINTVLVVLWATCMFFILNKILDVLQFLSKPILKGVSKLDDMCLLLKAIYDTKKTVQKDMFVVPDIEEGIRSENTEDAHIYIVEEENETKEPENDINENENENLQKDCEEHTQDIKIEIEKEEKKILKNVLRTIKFLLSEKMTETTDVDTQDENETEKMIATKKHFDKIQECLTTLKNL